MCRTVTVIISVVIWSILNLRESVGKTKSLGHTVPHEDNHSVHIWPLDIL